MSCGLKQGSCANHVREPSPGLACCQVAGRRWSAVVSGRRVLIVDDNALGVALVRLVLEGEAFAANLPHADDRPTRCKIRV